MRVVHVAKWDSAGGASISMLRLHKELINKGIDSIVLCERSSGTVENVELIDTGWMFHRARIVERLIGCFAKLQKDESLFFNSVNIRPNNLLKRINELNPDIVHLHWVGSGVLRIEDLPKIKQPIVWTLHDMWAFCGSEHYNLGISERWKKAYSKESRNPSAKGFDLTRWVWRRKFRCWQNIPIRIVSPSSWMRNSASNSSLWRDNIHATHHTIPAGLDTSTFKPIAQSAARKELALEDDVPLLLFGAASLSSRIKGGNLLRKALELAQKRGFKFQLACFGAEATVVVPGIKTCHLGPIRDLKKLATIYSSADVVLVPSKMESFGQVASEALACGTPVLCFDTSGLKDIVEHKVCGYRAECFSIDDFVDGLEWLLRTEDTVAIRKAARERALDKFPIGKVADAHIELYSNILEPHKQCTRIA